MFKNEYDKYLRKPHRLKGFDYGSDAYYYVTICTNNRFEFFGKIMNHEIQFNQIGLIAKKYWLQIPNHFPFVKLDKFIVMPNHIHGIIIIDKLNVASGNCPMLQIEPKMDLRHYNKFYKIRSRNLFSIIRAYKSSVKRYTNKNDLEFNWQSKFYDRIIRNDKELNRIREYIKNNPLMWNRDRNNINNK